MDWRKAVMKEWPHPCTLQCMRICLPSPSTHRCLSLYLTSLPFCLWKSSLSPNILCVRNAFSFKYAKIKVESLEVHFVIEVWVASPWIPIAPLWCLTLDTNSSSCAHFCFSSKVWGGPLRTARVLRGCAFVALVHYHLCQPSLLCKQALIFKDFPSLSTTLNHTVTRAQGIVL